MLLAHAKININNDRLVELTFNLFLIFYCEFVY